MSNFKTFKSGLSRLQKGNDYKSKFMVIESGKGGIGKTTVAISISLILGYAVDRDINVLLLTSDANGSLENYFTEDFLANNLPKNLNLIVETVENVNKKTHNQIQNELTEKLLSGVRRHDYVDLDEDDMADYYYKDSNDKITPIDVVLVDRAGGLDKTDVSLLSANGIDSFITIATANSKKALVNAMEALERSMEADHQLLLKMIADNGDSIEDYSDEEIKEIKLSSGTQHTLVYNHLNTAGSDTHKRITKTEIQEIEKRFNKKVNFVDLPFYNFERIESEGQSYFANRDELRKNGVKVGVFKLLVERSDMMAAMKNLMLSVMR
ncbi:ArsA-related P-loop ATPase [Vibrio parahaemolyticus]